MNTYRYVFIFFFITFVGAAIESGSYFLLPYLTGIGVPVGHLGGLIMGICYGVSFLIRPLAPHLENRAGLKKMLCGGYFCYFVSTLGLAFFANKAIFVLLWRSLTGLGFSLVGVSLLGYQTRFIPENKRGYSVALITTAYSLPSLVLVPALEYLIKNSYLRTYIIFFPVLVTIGFAAVMKLPAISIIKDDPGIKETHKTYNHLSSYADLMKRPGVIVFICSVALFAITDAGQLTFILLADELNIPASYFFSVSAVVALIFRITCGRILDFLPRNLCTLGAIVLTSSALFLITCTKNPTQLMGCGAVYGIGMGVGFPALMCIMLDIGGEFYVTRLAVIFGLIYSGMFFLVPIIIGFVFAVLGSAVLTYQIIYAIIFSISLLIFANSFSKSRTKYQN